MSESNTTDNDSDHTLLASVYLDGEASPDQRALVETSPESLAEVDELGNVRMVLAATAPEASLSEREGHLAGALDVWERMSDNERLGNVMSAGGVDAAAAAALSTPTSSSNARRRRAAKRSKNNGGFGGSQWFLSAAAALVVVAGGAAIVRGILDQEPENNDVAIESLQADASSELATVEENEAAEVNDENVGNDGLLPADQIEGEVFAQESNNAETGLFAEEQAQPEGEQELPEDAQPEGERVGVDPTAAASDEALSVHDSVPLEAQQPPPAAEQELTPLVTVEDLADFGSLSVFSVTGQDSDIADVDYEPPAGSCEAQLGIEKKAGFAEYQDQPVQVGVDLDAPRTVFAYTDDCVMVASAPLPDGERSADSAPSAPNP
jgi:hypothetical protein